MTQVPLPHVPVLIDPILKAIAPVSGRWLDGTFGAGGYTRALLDAGASTVLAVDRDPEVFERASAWAQDYGDRLILVPGEFGQLDGLARQYGAETLDGVVLDIGVSSMQIDQPERGFSFMLDGPLDMRMAQTGLSAADIVNTSDASVLADILFQYGEERASRRIAQAIIKARAIKQITTTGALKDIIEDVLPKGKPGQAHPATRSFQALRIAVNDELGELVRGLAGAESILAEGGVLAVVTFHSLEDRIVKRFLQARSGSGPKGSRYAPAEIAEAPRFDLIGRKAIVADKEEVERNPRARSAKLRLARRTSEPAGAVSGRGLGLPGFDQGRLT